MVKEGFVFVFLFLVLLGSFGVFAAEGDLADQLADDPIVEGTEELVDFYEEKRWEYLSEQWKELLLKNRAVSGVDRTFRAINPVFVILFGQDYDLSLSLFFVVLIWIFFTLYFHYIFLGFSPFSQGVSLVIGVILSIVLAQLGFFALIAEWVFKLIFFKTGFWSWIAVFIFFIFYVIFIGYCKRICWKFRRWRAKDKEETKKIDAKYKMMAFEERLNAIEKGFGGES